MKPVWEEKEKTQSSFKDLIIDAGKYVGSVKKAEWVNSPYSITEYNKEGLCLSVWIDIPVDANGETKRIFDKISITSPTKLNQLRVCAGLKPIKKGDNFNEKQIIGSKVYVEIDEYTSKAGKVSNIVKQYLEEEAVEHEEERQEYTEVFDTENDARVPF